MICKNNVTILLLLIFTCTNSCKYELSKNKTLIFETEFIYSFEKSEKLDSIRNVESELTQVKFIKLDPTIDNLSNTNKYLSKHLSNCIKKGVLHIEVGGDVGTIQDLSALNYLVHYDTVTRNDVFETSMLISSSRAFEKWRFFKIKQRWWYDKKVNKLNVVAEKITPLLKDRNGKQISNFSIPSCQKINDIDEIKVILNDENNIWIKQTNNYISFKSIDFIEGDEKQLKNILWDDVLKKETKVYKKDYNGKLVNFDAENLLRGRIDTIITFDPETYEERIEVRKHSPPLYSEIEGYNITQLWYFNNKEMKLKSKLIEVEPLILDTFENKLTGLYILK